MFSSDVCVRRLCFTQAYVAKRSLTLCGTTMFKPRYPDEERCSHSVSVEARNSNRANNSLMVRSMFHLNNLNVPKH